jgi:hypothetical protein
VNEAFVRAAVAQASEGKGSYLRIPRGVYQHQDMYIVVNGPPSELAEFKYARGPVGHLDTCEKADPRILKLREVMQRCLPFALRPDVVAAFSNDPSLASSGFSRWCRIPEYASGSSPVTVKVVSGSGLDTVIYHDRIVSAAGQ